MVEHLYGISFNKLRCPHLLNQMKAEPAAKDRARTFTMHVVDLHRLGWKYAIPTLCAHAKAFVEMSVKILEERPAVEDLCAVAKYVYLTCADSAYELRPLVLAAILPCLDGALGEPAFKAALAELPELSFDMVQALAKKDNVGPVCVIPSKRARED